MKNKDELYIRGTKLPETNKCKDCGAWHPLNDDELCEFCAEPEEEDTVAMGDDDCTTEGYTPGYVGYVNSFF